MKIGLLKKSQSYVPEAIAYKKYLENFNHKVDIFSNSNLIKEYDKVILFMGFYPRNLSPHTELIHEYNSLSLQPFSLIKNKIKVFLNHTPRKRIFLNSFVKYFFNFRDNIKYIFRDMGVDQEFFNLNNLKNQNHIYDIVYTGSVENREGIVSCLINLSNLGFKTAIIGRISDNLFSNLQNYKNIYFLGELNINEICNVYKVTTCGLNYTPNIFPFNYQTSTKTLEYSAAGLKIISNRYFWIESFEKSRAARFLYLDKLKSKDQIYNFKFEDAKIKDKEWNLILNKINFKQFIES
tara:strand:+ start:2060 stop:2941 length:882 start_codon:yes stop_codon:yes gene_type:complete